MTEGDVPDGTGVALPAPAAVLEAPSDHPQVPSSCVVGLPDDAGRIRRSALRAERWPRQA